MLVDGDPRSAGERARALLQTWCDEIIRHSLADNDLPNKNYADPFTTFTISLQYTICAARSLIYPLMYSQLYFADVMECK